MVIASLYRAATLARGGGHVARMLGATRVSGEGNDPLQRRLVNVVEEMALAAGLPVPEIYVLEQEAGINAFAAGLTSADAAIAVTRGALEQLERAELQGVIAHEFSHILNGDMRLNQQLIGLSFGILVLSLAGRWLLRSVRYTGGGRRGRNSGGVAAALAIGLALIVIGGIGVLLSRLIKAGVSRQRETPRRRIGRAVHARARGTGRRSEKNRGLFGAHRVGGYRRSRAHAVRARHAAPSPAGLRPIRRCVERIRTLEPSFDPRRSAPAEAARADRARRDNLRRFDVGTGRGSGGEPRRSSVRARSRRRPAARCARRCPTRSITRRGRTTRAC